MHIVLNYIFRVVTTNIYNIKSLKDNTCINVNTMITFFFTNFLQNFNDIINLSSFTNELEWNKFIYNLTI